MYLNYLLVVGVMVTSLHCVAASSAAPPPELKASQVTVIRVTVLYPTVGETRHIIEPSVVLSIARSSAFAARAWQAAEGRDLVPMYRLEFLHDDTVAATYYLGTNSNPPRFPCYWFCSGWWLGAAAADGSLDPTRYLGLSENMYLPLTSDLDVP